MEQVQVLAQSENSATIELSWKTEPKACSIESINFRFAHHYQRMMVREKVEAEAVLRGELFQSILGYLVDSGEIGILSAKDVEINLPGAKIRHLRITKHPARADKHFATVQLVEIFGNALNILTHKYNATEASYRQSVDLATLALIDVVKPCLELFDHILANGMTEETAQTIRPRLQTMKVKGEALSGYFGELTDTVCNLNRDVARTRSEAVATVPALQDRAKVDVLFGHHDALDARRAEQRS